METRMHFDIPLFRLQDEGKAEQCTSKQLQSNRGWGLRGVSGPCPPLSLPTFILLPRGRDHREKGRQEKKAIIKSQKFA